MLKTRWNEQIQRRIDNKTKPLGALGHIESLAFHLAQIQSHQQNRLVTEINIDKPHLILFAADHGIAAQNVSIAPSAVTQQMVANFLAGGAAINGFCRVNQVDMTVVDCGMLAPISISSLSHQSRSETAPEHSSATFYLTQRLGAGTADFSQHAAMSEDQVNKGLQKGAELVKMRVAQGNNVLLFGEMGIGNTSSSSALLALLTGAELTQCVGRGTGIDDQQYQRKCQLIEQALVRVATSYGESITAEQMLMEVGGFEIVQMVGAMLAAGKLGIPIVIDGFIVSVAALLAVRIEPATRDIMLFAHCSAEAGHEFVLQTMDAKPLLHLGLRLGEGSGAVMAYPLLRCASEFYNRMASFQSAGVTV